MKCKHCMQYHEWATLSKTTGQWCCLLDNGAATVVYLAVLLSFGCFIVLYYYFIKMSRKQKHGSRNLTERICQAFLAQLGGSLASVKGSMNGSSVQLNWEELKEHESEAGNVAGLPGDKEIPWPHCLPSGCLHLSSQLQEKLHDTFINLCLPTHSGPSSSTPGLSPLTCSTYLVKGAGIETFKVRNGGSYCLHFSQTACCAASSLSSCVPFSCLSLQTDILYICMHVEENANPAPSSLTSQVRCLTPKRFISLGPVHPNSLRLPV